MMYIKFSSIKFDDRLQAQWIKWVEQVETPDGLLGLDSDSSDKSRFMFKFSADCCQQVSPPSLCAMDVDDHQPSRV
jgi:hypothetical protein